MITPKEDRLIQLYQSGIELHERALSDLQAKLVQLERDYNKRGYDLAMEQRREMDLDNVHHRAEIVASDGSKLPSMDMVIIDSNSDVVFKRLREDCDFTRGEITRISKKLEVLRAYLRAARLQAQS